MLKKSVVLSEVTEVTKDACLVSGRRNQCRTETFIVAFAYMVITAGFIKLVSKSSNNSSNYIYEKVSDLVSLIAIVVTVYMMMSFLQEKLGGYPVMETAKNFIPVLFPFLYGMFMLFRLLKKHTYRILTESI